MCRLGLALLRMVSHNCGGEGTFSVVTFYKGCTVVPHRSGHMIQPWFSVAQQAAPAAAAWATHGHQQVKTDRQFSGVLREPGRSSNPVRVVLVPCCSAQPQAPGQDRVPHHAARHAGTSTSCSTTSSSNHLMHHPQSEAGVKVVLCCQESYEPKKYVMMNI